MPRDTDAQRHLKKLPGFQRQAIEKLLADAKPFKPAWPIYLQWSLWLALSVLTVALALSFIGARFELVGHLMDEPSAAVFLGLVFLGSALSAWAGIASSMPGEEPRRAAKVVAGLFLLFLFAMPFLFFGRDPLGGVLDRDMAEGWFCFRTVAIVAIPSWVVLGLLASRNASFRPGWTGAWLGVSSFLLGTGTIQMHCARWESCHMFIDHMLPMVLLIALPVWIGSFWFSRWKK